MKQGQLYINGELCPRQPEGEYLSDDNGIKLMSKLYQETLPNGVKHYVLHWEREGDLDNAGPFDVPEGHYFMMGDNRDNSIDSRVPRWQGGVGFMPAQNLIGRADIGVGAAASARCTGHEVGVGGRADAHREQTRAAELLADGAEELSLVADGAIREEHHLA